MRQEQGKEKWEEQRGGVQEENGDECASLFRPVNSDM